MSKNKGFHTAVRMRGLGTQKAFLGVVDLRDRALPCAVSLVPLAF